MRAFRTFIVGTLTFIAGFVTVVALLKNRISPDLHETLLWSPLIEHRGRLSLLLAKIRSKKLDKDHQTPKETGVIALITLFDLLLSRDQHYKYLWLQEQREQAATAGNGVNGTKDRSQTLPM
jgi:hypothetical protein